MSRFSLSILTKLVALSLILLATQTQTQAIGITRWKRNWTQLTQARAKSSEPSKLFRREVIWIEYFHWPNINTCGRYHCVCVMPERYFVFTCGSANPSISVSTRKAPNFGSCACAWAYACLGIKIIVFALVHVCACVWVARRGLILIDFFRAQARWIILRY